MRLKLKPGSLSLFGQSVKWKRRSSLQSSVISTRLREGDHRTDPKKVKRKGKAADRKTGGPVGDSLQKGFSSALVARVSLL